MPEIRYGFFNWSESTAGLRELTEKNPFNYEINERLNNLMVQTLCDLKVLVTRVEIFV
jgi:hypothetical protein